jgi:uncharacterized small protein (DUF1192 family)
MTNEPDEPRRKKSEVLLGEDIYYLSVPDLEERIAALEVEVARCRDAIKARNATKSAADILFKK